MLKTAIKAAAMAAALSATLAASAFADGAHVTADEIAWEGLGLPGIELALAWGSEEAGDAVWLIRMAPGAELPSHAHTNDYWGLTISGNWVHVHEDGSATPTSAGDYALVEGGVFHGDRCEGDVPCIGILDFDGERDAIFPD